MLPLPAKHKITISHDADTYEFVVQATLIMSIVKIIGDSGMRRDVDYEFVPFNVKEELHSQMNEL
jgi:hypothetical protein